MQGVKADQVFSTPSGHLVRINNNTADSMDKQVRSASRTKAQELNDRYKSQLEKMKVRDSCICSSHTACYALLLHVPQYLVLDEGWRDVSVGGCNDMSGMCACLCR